MPKAWLSIPSARPLSEISGTLLEWKQQGYGIALWRDEVDDVAKLLVRDGGICIVGKYPGYATAVNRLVSAVIATDPAFKWAVMGGDDTLPDRTKRADEIADELTEHFKGTFGVMQPTGDRWADGSIDRICGSAWLGRDWCARAHNGAGPLCPVFSHMFVDESLQYAAIAESCFLQRRDLTHLHNHYTRTNKPWPTPAVEPPHMAKWNSPQHWSSSKALFERFKIDHASRWRALPA